MQITTIAWHAGELKERWDLWDWSQVLALLQASLGALGYRAGFSPDRSDTERRDDCVDDWPPQAATSSHPATSCLVSTLRRRGKETCPPPSTTSCFTTRSSRRWGRCSTGRCWRPARWDLAQWWPALGREQNMVTVSLGRLSLHPSSPSHFKRELRDSQSCPASPLDSASKSSEITPFSQIPTPYIDECFSGTSTAWQFSTRPWSVGWCLPVSALETHFFRQTAGPEVSMQSWLFPVQMSLSVVPRSGWGSAPVLPTLSSSSLSSGSMPQRSSASSWASSCWEWSVSSLWSSLRWASTLRGMYQHDKVQRIQCKQRFFLLVPMSSVKCMTLNASKTLVRNPHLGMGVL